MRHSPRSSGLPIFARSRAFSNCAAALTLASSESRPIGSVE